MNDLERQMRQENTEYLQEKIRTNAYIDEVAAIAVRVLRERNATVPTPETDDEVEEKVKLHMRLSTHAFLLVVVWLVIVLIFQPSAVKTILFGLALASSLAYLHSQKKK